MNYTYEYTEQSLELNQRVKVIQYFRILNEFQITEEEYNKIKDRMHEKINPEIYYIGQIFFDILDTLGQTDFNQQ